MATDARSEAREHDAVRRPRGARWPRLAIQFFHDRRRTTPRPQGDHQGDGQAKGEQQIVIAFVASRVAGWQVSFLAMLSGLTEAGKRETASLGLGPSESAHCASYAVTAGRLRPPAGCRAATERPRMRPAPARPAACVATRRLHRPELATWWLHEPEKQKTNPEELA